MIAAGLFIVGGVCALGMFADEYMDLYEEITGRGRL